MGKQTICGLIANKSEAEKIILKLVETGIDASKISVLSSQTEAMRESTVDSATRNWRTETRIPKNGEAFAQTAKSKFETHTHAAEGATAGATTGGVVGGTLGLLVGIGALAIPGIGPLVAAGPLLAALSGLGAGGTLGGIIGALIGVGIPEKHARHYEHSLKEGEILISVNAQNDKETTRVLDILQKHGARNVTVSETLSVN